MKFQRKEILTLETHPTIHFCPICGFKMHSRGIKTRTINHPILHDTYELILKLKQRRWRCTNQQCSYTTNETFDRFVKMDRLPLSDIISVDEVFLELDYHCKYALVIQDFYTGNPIDLLSSRRTNSTEPYFMNIPFEERERLKYLISDMYNPYIQWVGRYFLNAVSVVDSFHVIQWITHKKDMYIRNLIKSFKKRDKENFIANGGIITEHTYIPPSREVYLLQKYRWLILANRSSIFHHTDLRMDTHLHCMINTYDYENSLFMINPNLRELRDLKKLYISFNNRNTGKIYSSRLSNGPIESLNRKVKDLKRQGRGYRNFELFRTRFLYATRDNPIINGVTDYNPVTYYDMDEEEISLQLKAGRPNYRSSC